MPATEVKELATMLCMMIARHIYEGCDIGERLTFDIDRIREWLHAMPEEERARMMGDDALLRERIGATRFYVHKETFVPPPYMDKWLSPDNPEWEMRN